MDWYSWLSKTNLSPSNTYEYSLALARNELEEDDLAHFDHEFLRSLGISVAKHRLEILKLARRHKIKATGLTKIIGTVNKRITTLGIKLAPFLRKRSSPEYHRTPYDSQWNGGNNIITARSGPLMSREIGNKAAVVERNRRTLSHNLSGPLHDGKMMQSPSEHGGAKKCRRSKTLHEFGERGDELYHRCHHRCSSECKNTHVPSLWSLMFQDLRPT